MMLRNTIRQLLWLVGCICFISGLAPAQSDGGAAAQYAVADLVFTGTLEKLDASPTGFMAKFEFSQIIKGKKPKDKYVQALLPAETRCHKLEELNGYLVYAHRVAGQLWIDPCDGAKLISQAEADLRYIHSFNPAVSEKCNKEHLDRLAARSPIIVKAEVLGTEDSLRTSITFDRPWCGVMFTTEDAFYKVIAVMKGEVKNSPIVVEHPICSGTITVDGYEPRLSSQLFTEGNMLLLFLEPGSHRSERTIPPPARAVYQDTDENCGAVMADDQAARSFSASLRDNPDKYKTPYYDHWLNEDVNCLEDGSEGEGPSCFVRIPQKDPVVAKDPDQP